MWILVLTMCGLADPGQRLVCAAVVLPEIYGGANGCRLDIPEATESGFDGLRRNDYVPVWVEANCTAITARAT